LKKLDWYILKKFLAVFFFAIFLFAVIAVVIDASEKTDDFVKSGLSAGEVITHYYYGFIPHIIALLFPLFVFIAVIFFTSKMAGQTEIVAIIASGVSYNRWLRPYVLGGALLGLFLWVSNQWIIPKAEKIRGGFEATYIDARSSYNALLQSSSDIYFKIDSLTYAGIYGYDTATNRGSNYFSYQVKNGKVISNIRAEMILYDTATKDWLLYEVIERKVFDNREALTYTQSMHKKLAFKPVDLEKDRYTKDKLTTPTSITVVEINTSISPRENSDIVLSFTSEANRPCKTAILRPFKAPCPKSGYNSETETIGNFSVFSFSNSSSSTPLNLLTLANASALSPSEFNASSVESFSEIRGATI